MKGFMFNQGCILSTQNIEHYWRKTPKTHFFQFSSNDICQFSYSSVCSWNLNVDIRRMNAVEKTLVRIQVKYNFPKHIALYSKVKKFTRKEMFEGW